MIQACGCDILCNQLAINPDSVKHSAVLAAASEANAKAKLEAKEPWWDAPAGKRFGFGLGLVLGFGFGRAFVSIQGELELSERHRRFG